jgi:hypothetical protein
MAGAIKDEFTELLISRQRRYQMRKQRDKRCQMCGGPVITGSFCLLHLTENRERVRKRLGYKLRYNNALTYRLASKEAKKLVQVRAGGD